MIPNQQNQKERKPETGSKMKKAHVIIRIIYIDFISVKKCLFKSFTFLTVKLDKSKMIL